MDESYFALQKQGREGTMQASEGRKESIALPTCDTYEWHQQLAWHDNSNGKVMMYIPMAL